MSQPAGGIPVQKKSGLDLPPGPLQVAIGNFPVYETLQLMVQHLLGQFEVGAVGKRHQQLVEVGMTSGMEAGVDMGGDLGIDQGPVQAGSSGGAFLQGVQADAPALGPTQDGVQDPQPVKIALVNAGGPKSQLQVGDTARSGQAQPPFSPLLRLRQRHPGRGRSPGNGTEAAADRSHGPVRIEIADQYQNGIGRRVIAAVVVPKPAALHLLHVRDPSPGRPAIGVPLQGRGRHLPVQCQSGIILSSQQLGDDQTPFQFDTAGLEAFMPQGPGRQFEQVVQIVFHHRSKVGGLVQKGVTLQQAGGMTGDPGAVGCGRRLAGAESQVFDEMGDAGRSQVGIV